MTLLVETQRRAKKYGMQPRRERGQNFLVDERVVDRMFDAADLAHDDHVLEVGGGLGTLTRALATKVGKVTVVEIDEHAVRALTDLEKQYPNIEVIKDDILAVNLQEVLQAPTPKGPKRSALEYKIVASLPYNITSKFFRNIFEHQPLPLIMVVLIQKEVAERITAEPGKMSILAVSVQYFAEVDIVDNVPASAFWPSPRVESVIIRIVPKSDARDFRTEAEPFFRVVRMGFSNRRKQLRNNLKVGFNLENDDVNRMFASVGIEPTARAQNLSVEQWQELTKVLRPSLIESDPKRPF